jgi:hypothetical protein
MERHTRTRSRTAVDSLAQRAPSVAAVIRHAGALAARLVGRIAQVLPTRRPAPVAPPPDSTVAARTASGAEPGSTEDPDFVRRMAKRGVDLFDHEHDHGYVPRAADPTEVK